MGQVAMKISKTTTSNKIMNTKTVEEMNKNQETKKLSSIVRFYKNEYISILVMSAHK